MEGGGASVLGYTITEMTSDSSGDSRTYGNGESCGGDDADYSGANNDAWSGVVLQVYDYDTENPIKINDVVEAVGYYYAAESLNQHEHHLAMDSYNSAKYPQEHDHTLDMFEEMDLVDGVAGRSELRAKSPKIHCFLVRKLCSSFPLLKHVVLSSSVSSGTCDSGGETQDEHEDRAIILYNFVAPPPPGLPTLSEGAPQGATDSLCPELASLPPANIPTLLSTFPPTWATSAKSALVTEVAAALGGDTLAAEYVCLCVLSRAYARPSSTTGETGKVMSIDYYYTNITKPPYMRTEALVESDEP